MTDAQSEIARDMLPKQPHDGTIGNHPLNTTAKIVKQIYFHSVDMYKALLQAMQEESQTNIYMSRVNQARWHQDHIYRLVAELKRIDPQNRKRQ